MLPVSPDKPASFPFTYFGWWKWQSWSALTVDFNLKKRGVGVDQKGVHTQIEGGSPPSLYDFVA